MSSFKKLFDNISTFTKIKNPLYIKYYFNRKLVRYDQRHSLQNNNIIIDNYDQSMIEYNFFNNNKRLLSKITIYKNEYNKNKLIYISHKIRYGQQSNESIKTYYTNYTLCYKIIDTRYILYKKYGEIFGKSKEVLLQSNNIMKQFIKYISIM
jgi:hypothetical protein